MSKKNIRNLVDSALDDISGIPERKGTPVPDLKGKRKTKMVCIRFPEKDMEKLEAILKIKTGESNFSAGIRKIIYMAMHEEDLI